MQCHLDVLNTYTNTNNKKIKYIFFCHLNESYQNGIHFNEKSLSYILAMALRDTKNHLFKKAVYQCNCPNSILEVIPNSSSQKLIPDKHGLIKDVACFTITQIPLKTTHDTVWVAKIEILRKVNR